LSIDDAHGGRGSFKEFWSGGGGGAPALFQAQDKKEEDGAWAPSEEWWSKDREIAMCHEVIDELMSSR
jgi:hypothetical protein